MKRVVLLFLFSLITLILAEWAAAYEITCRLKPGSRRPGVGPLKRSVAAIIPEFEWLLPSSGKTQGGDFRL
jgi:hypothetical protein